MPEKERERKDREKTRGVELKGQQLRARKERPSKFERGSFRTKSLGKGERKGRVQVVVGKTKGDGYKTQSMRLNLSKFDTPAEAKASAARNLDLTPKEETKAGKLIDQHFEEDQPK